ncbi:MULTISPECIES: Hcp family type VI secretion system effector [Rahnella]|uniref:Hcp family type VI secretion system effector n=1 Tax=Rahnella TaxID=34037 RepID=UPI0018A2C503|nr:Hcp family type VI secretion system effector [Rahnella laticis]MBF7994897.1 Hcp family type VI secretion system effector [Rahnella laticis]
MANLTYLTLNGQTQGLISAGCSSLDSIGNKAQIGNIDKIMVYSMKHTLSRDQNVNHHEVTILKPIDKSSPLLGKAITDNEILTCDLELYRTNKVGMGECYYKVKLTGARITNIDFIVPHSILESEAEAQERVSFSYETITWEHCIAGTSAYSLWNERVY